MDQRIKTCFVDLDGLLANFVKGVCEVHERIDPYLSGPNIFEMPKIWGMSNTEFWNKITYDTWRNFELMPDAREIFETLAYKFGTENICILTAPAHTFGCFDAKRDWVKEHFGLSDKQILAGGGKHYCAHPNTLLVDDYDKNCDAWTEAGGKCFLFPRMWNRRHSQANSGIDLLRSYLCEL